MKRVILSVFVVQMLMTLSCRVWADVTYTQSKWSSAVNGDFSDKTKWDAGVVPTKSATDVVNGYLFNKETDYTVYLDKTATLNYLHIGQDYNQNQPGRSALVITNDLVLASQNGSFTGYNPAAGKEATISRRSLWIEGANAEAIVKDGANLTIRPDITDNTWYDSDIVHIKNGARLLVTNATLTLDALRNSSYGNQHLHFDVVGTVAATSRLDVVDSTLELSSPDDVYNYYGAIKFKEYSRGVFSNATFNIRNGQFDYRGTAGRPAPEMLFTGSTRIWDYRTGNGRIFNGGHIVFNGDATYYEASNSGKTRYVGCDSTSDNVKESGSMLVEFLGNSSADFTTYADSNHRGGTFKVCGYTGYNKGSLTTLKIDTTGAFKAPTSFYIGEQYGEGRLELRKGDVTIPWRSVLSLGHVAANQTDAAVTGRLDIAGGSLTFGDTSTCVTGMLVGDGCDPANPESSPTQYSYGEVNMTGGAITNTSGLWIGTGPAIGIFRQTGGRHVVGNSCFIGAGGGKGEYHLLGGTLDLLDPSKSPSQWSSSGGLLVGGVTRTLIKERYGRDPYVSGKTSMPQYFDFDAQGEGYLCVSNATLRMGAYGANHALDIGNNGQGTLELMNGADAQLSYVCATNGARSHLKFKLSGTAPPTMLVRNQFSVSAGAKLTVDARGYAGAGRWIQLVKFLNDANRWGSFRGVAKGDRFDTDCITTLGNVRVVQVHDAATEGRAPGIWAHYTSGLAVIVR